VKSGIAKAFARFVRHLRLPMQMVLAPIFLLGFALGQGSVSWVLIGLFLLLHVGLYGGATAYNSYYDQDEGPIGGMKYPPGVGPWEKWGGLGIQLIAVFFLSCWDGRIGGLAAVMFVMGLAYSHPSIRLKARPWSSLLLVALGQGAFPFSLGWWASASSAAWPPLWGVIASTALVAGFYPLTQVYQIEEDRGRGDMTFAVRYGMVGAFVAARLFVGMGLLMLAWVLWEAGRVYWSGPLLLGYGAYWLALHRWQRHFALRDIYQNHDWSFAICAGLALAFWGLVVALWLF